ncbi:MAG: acetolactate synthase small subunit [Gammaproteobacteria bacterium]|nr:MAG: acetolactate synthase small subunit [Gammaproteobacteria bacterium]
MRHIISILLQNEAGALSRVASLFSTRGYNIESLNVAPTEHPEVSRLTLVTIGSDQVISQINKQLLKLVDVVNLADMTLGDHIERELALVKLRVPPAEAGRVQSLAAEKGIRVLDDSLDSYTLEITGTGSQIDDFIDRAMGVGEILSVVRSGPLAIARGRQVLSGAF